MFLGKHLHQKDAAPADYIYRVTSKHGKVQQLHIGIKSDTGFPLVIKRERFYHRFLKSIGLAHEVETSNQSLNKKLFFITDYPHHLKMLLESSKLQEALAQLFSSQIKGVYAAKGRIWAVVGGSDKQRPLSSFIEEVEHLRELGKALAQTSHQQTGLQERKLMWIAGIFIIAHFGLFITALGGWAAQLIDSVQMVSNVLWISSGLYYGLFALGLWFAAIIIIFRKSSWIGWVLADFLLYGWIGILVCSVYLVRDMNVMLDQSEAVIHTMPVTRKNCALHCSNRYGKRSKTRTYQLSALQCAYSERPATMAEYQNRDYVCRSSAHFTFDVYTKHWNPAINSYHYQPNSQHFDAVDYGTLIDIPTHAGALGIEWVELKDIKVAQ